MLAEYLGTGKDNAITGRQLAITLNCNIRDIGQLAENERRKGAAICASSNGENNGYYLAANAAELNDYIGRLHHREKELAETRKALVKTLKLISEKQSEV